MNEEEKKETAVTETETAGMQRLRETENADRQVMSETPATETAVSADSETAAEAVSPDSAAVAETPKNGLIAKFKAWWKRFSEKHPKGSKLIWQFIKFFVFSNGVTIFQYLVYTFLPYAFGLEMAKIEWIWPGIELPWGVKWTIIGFAPAATFFKPSLTRA